MVIPREGLTAIKLHVSILDRIKYTSAQITSELLKGLFDMQSVLVSNAVYDSSAIGSTDAITSIWGDTCFLGWKPARPSPLKPSCGYIFKNAKQMGKRWRDEERASEAIEVSYDIDPKIVASLTGYLIKDNIKIPKQGALGASFFAPNEKTASSVFKTEKGENKMGRLDDTQSTIPAVESAIKRNKQRANQKAANKVVDSWFEIVNGIKIVERKKMTSGSVYSTFVGLVKQNRDLADNLKKKGKLRIKNGEVQHINKL